MLTKEELEAIQWLWDYMSKYEGRAIEQDQTRGYGFDPPSNRDYEMAAKVSKILKLNAQEMPSEKEVREATSDLTEPVPGETWQPAWLIAMKNLCALATSDEPRDRLMAQLIVEELGSS
jgi:hypothetical protein